MSFLESEMTMTKNAWQILLAATLSVTSFTAVADDDDWQSANVKISPAQAAAIATTRISGDVVDLDFEYDDGRPYYEIEVQGRRNKHEIRIDANSGRIILDRVDYDDDDDNYPKKSPRSAATIPMQRAIALAERQTGARVKKVELKNQGKEDSYYEIETERGDVEYEVKIDAYNGRILKVERDD
jgi:uncharacterized membrane protein YkoI